MKSAAEPLIIDKGDPTKEATSPTVLNIVMLGTGEHQTTMKTVLTELASSIKPSPNQFVHFINGLGAKPAKDANQENDTMLGDYDFSSRFDVEKQALMTERKKRPFLNRTFFLKGLLEGKGYRDAIAEANNVVDAMIKGNKEPLIVNFYGFSRGADTSLRICNTIYEKYPDKNIKCNVLAIDPVAGPWRRSARKARLIPPNVERYECILMEDERRNEFTPQDKFRLKIANLHKTKVIHHFLPGVHSAATRFDVSTPSITEPQRVAWDIVEKFAKTVGTSLSRLIPFAIMDGNQYTTKAAVSLTDRERLVAYSKMPTLEIPAQSRKIYVSRREFVDNKHFYFLHGFKTFQDEQHLQLFKHYYPHFFDYFFQMNRAGNAKDDVISDINKIKNFPEVLSFLTKHDWFKFLNDAEVILGNPQGIPLVYDDFNKNEKLKHLWEAIQYAIFPILSGNDDSLPQIVAKQLLNDVYYEIISTKTDDKKIEWIESCLRSVFIRYAATNTLFETKLMSLVSLESFDPLRQAIKYLADVDNTKSSLLIAMQNTLSEIYKYEAKVKTEDPVADLLKLQRYKITAVRILIRHIRKDKHPQAKWIANYLMKRLKSDYGTSIADRVIGILSEHMKMKYCTKQEKMIAEHAIRIFEHLNKFTLGNDPELIRISIKKVEDELRLANLYDSKLKIALTEFSFLKLAIYSHMQITDAKHTILSEALTKFTRNVSKETLSGTITAYIKNNIKRLPDDFDEDFSAKKAKQILTTTDNYLSSINNDELKDNYQLNRAYKLANRAKEKLDDDADSNVKESAQKVLDKIKDSIDSFTANSTYQGNSIFRFFKRAANQSITRTNLSNETRVQFGYKFNPLEHEGSTRLTNSSYVFWAQKEIEAIRSQYIKQNGNDNDFVVVISGGFTSPMSQALATYCASESINYEDNVTNYKPEQSDIDSFVKELDTIRSKKANSTSPVKK